MKRLFIIALTIAGISFVLTGCPGPLDLELSGNITISPDSGVTTDTPLTAGYNGGESVSYQWNKDETAIPGAAGTTYTPTEVGNYTVTVSAPGYNRKTSGPVTVNNLPNLAGAISISPNSGVTTGTPLTAGYDGGESVSYQWNKNGSAIPGAANAAYTPTEAGSYTVTVSAPGYQSKTGGPVTVTLLPNLAGAINISPSGSVTTNTQLTAAYSGSESGVSYQWNKDGSAISGATGTSYTPTEAGSYTVTVSAPGFNSKTGGPVTVTGVSLPGLSGTITINPNSGVTTGTELTADYSGSEGVSYQWNKNGSAVSGAANAAYTPTEAGTYTVTVSAPGYRSKTSAAVTVSTGGGSEPTPAERAAELAAAINNMEGQSEGSVGSATASGATVTITGGFVDVRANLTVPAGVTLDVTAGDGAALGLHNVTLTVNGTVNAGPGYIRLEDTADWGTINGSGTIRLVSRGSLFWVDGNRAARTLTLEGVTLDGLTKGGADGDTEDNDEPVVGIGEGGVFVMKSGLIRGNTNTRDDDDWSAGGGVGVWEGGTFTMEGGRISGNRAIGRKGGAGGGVALYKGTFTMKGGEISDNSTSGAEGATGAVAVGEDSTFTMEGGKISGNSAQGGSWANGGGVWVHEGVSFTMEGGEISGNTAQGGSWANGGGVWVEGEDASFTMKNGEISGNTAQDGSEGGSGGGVSVNDSTFTMSGGAIYGNTAEYGGGVNTHMSTFIMSGGRIQGSADSDDFTKNTGTANWAALNLSGNSTATFGPGGGKVGSDVKDSNAAIVDSTDETIIAPAP
jgi:hypothetical protein